MSSTSSAIDANLTSEGSLDWVHWGDGSLIRKAGGGTQLSRYTVVGSGPVNRYANDPRTMRWTNGTPTASSSSNRNGVFITGVGNGFAIVAPADTTTRTLTVHVGGWASGGRLTAHLSDGSAVDFVDTTPTATGQYDRNYTLTYSAGSSGQTLRVTWMAATDGWGGYGNVTVNGAALAASPSAP